MRKYYPLHNFSFGCIRIYKFISNIPIDKKWPKIATSVFLILGFAQFSFSQICLAPSPPTAVVELTADANGVIPDINYNTANTPTYPLCTPGCPADGDDKCFQVNVTIPNSGNFVGCNEFDFCWEGTNGGFDAYPNGDCALKEDNITGNTAYCASTLERDSNGKVVIVFCKQSGSVQVETLTLVPLCCPPPTDIISISQN